MNKISENVLYFALNVFCESIPESSLSNQSLEIIVNYIVNDWYLQGKEEFTVEDIQESLSLMISDHIMIKLSNDGKVESLVTETGDIEYQITEIGRKTLEKELKKLEIIK